MRKVFFMVSFVIRLFDLSLSVFQPKLCPIRILNDSIGLLLV